MNNDELKRDFLGRNLCLHCFNNAHYVRKTNLRTGRKVNGKAGLVSNCLYGGCECLCGKVLKQQNDEKKNDAREHADHIGSLEL